MPLALGKGAAADAVEAMLGDAWAEAERRKLRLRTLEHSLHAWPERHLVGIDGRPVPYHLGQDAAWDSERRTVGVFAGAQGGKTGFLPWWLRREIDRTAVAGGGNDYLAVTATYDLFKLKMLPGLLQVFEDILQVGRYWSGDRIIELLDPETGGFWAKRAVDLMWGRIILRSADALGGLESGTARAAVLDECGQDRFTLDAYRAVNRRLSLHQGRKLLTTTLYNLGWVDSQVISPAHKGGRVTVTRAGAGEVEVVDNAAKDICAVHFDSVVNPIFPETEFELARATMPDDEFQMFYRGRRAQLRTLIYDCFDKDRHTCPRFPIPLGWKHYLGLDFGGANTAGVFYAEDPGSKVLYGYRIYKAGQKRIGTHVRELLEGEPGIPFAVGGAKGEEQWRQEFANAGLTVRGPKVTEVAVGINRVYAQHKADAIVYFDDLEDLIEEKGRYRRKRDKSGEVTEEIEAKATFHFMDAERYIVSFVRSEVDSSWSTMDDLGSVRGEDFKPRWE